MNSSSKLVSRLALRMRTAALFACAALLTCGPELAAAQARPWGVDACSRIECAPGKKDHKKMSEFLQAAKAALLA